jgi:hypothetical protein
MQKWIDVIRLANNGNLNPDQRIEKSEEEWKSLLTEEQFYVTRKKEQKELIAPKCAICLNPANMPVFVVTLYFLTAKKNFKVELGGLVLHSR